MDKKTFILILVTSLVTFSTAAVIQYYQPDSEAVVSFADMPLTIANWVGQREEIPQYVTDLLRPKDIFSASYVNGRGQSVHLLFDFFISDGSFGGPHSPRNCLPGSGWQIIKVEERSISINGMTIPAGRFRIRLNERQQVMDFWYVTSYGATASDYVFKLYSMLGSLSLKPREVAFIRFTAPGDPKSVEALDEFEKLIIPEIYSRLPFILE